MRKTKSVLQFRRKRQSKTNYKKRLKLLMAKKPRLCVRKSLNSISTQIIEYSPDGDKIVGGVNSKVLIKQGWKLGVNNTPSAYLTGYLTGKLAKEKGINGLILDIGFNKPVKGSKVYAVLKGVADSGINVPHNEDILPSEDRLNGKHIKKSKELNEEQIKKHIQEIKQKITGAKNE